MPTTNNNETRKVRNPDESTHSISEERPTLDSVLDVYFSVELLQRLQEDQQTVETSKSFRPKENKEPTVEFSHD